MLRRRAFCASGAGTREWGEARMALEIDFRCCVRVRLSDENSRWNGGKSGAPYALLRNEDLHYSPALWHDRRIVAQPSALFVVLTARARVALDVQLDREVLDRLRTDTPRRSRLGKGFFQPHNRFRDTRLELVVIVRVGF